MTATNAMARSLGRVVLFLITAGALVGCQSVFGPEDGGDTPDLALGKVPAPVGGVEALTFVYSSAEMLREEGGIQEWVSVAGEELPEAERTFDLLAVLGGFEAILGEATVQPGVYLRMRVLVASAVVTVDGDDWPLKVSGNALRINEEFEVGPSGQPSLPLDFDAALEVREKAKGRHRYTMAGVLRLGEAPPEPETGTISGVVVPSVYASVVAYESGTYNVVASVYTDMGTDAFLFTDLPPGTYDLEASAPGYYSGWEMGVGLAAGDVSDSHVLEMTEMVGGEKR